MPGHRLIIIASDGVWDVISDHQAVVMAGTMLADGRVRRHLLFLIIGVTCTTNVISAYYWGLRCLSTDRSDVVLQTLEDIAAYIVQEAGNRGSHDNITAMVIDVNGLHDRCG